MKKKISLSSTHIIMISFFCVILVGSILLSLPVSSSDGNPKKYIDALFTATTATCVTGLVTVTTATAWSTFGHVIILLLIQIGGLGTVAIMAGLIMLIHQRLSLKNRILIQDAFNLNSMSGLSAFVKRVILFTFSVEGLGAFGYATVFVPEYGTKGIWISVFTSVSAFCNAGIDIIKENSLCDYVSNPVINLVTCLLIICGGLGYTVWWDTASVIKKAKNRGRKWFRYLSLHSKVVLFSTAVLIFGGALAVFLFEYNNPQTIGNMPLADKISASLFQSVTTRTAGFATLPQEKLTNGSALVSLLLMFIGGSPAGTAGGIKTVTFTVLLASAISTVGNKNEIGIFSRNISKSAVSKALAVVSMSFFITFISSVALSAVTDADALDILYETVSAAATVGLTRNLTSSLGSIGKLIIIVTMYLGRIGPISLAVAFNMKKQKINIIKNPTEEVIIG